MAKKTKVTEEAADQKAPFLKSTSAAVADYFSGTAGSVWSGILIGLLCFGFAQILFK